MYYEQWTDKGKYFYVCKILVWMLLRPQNLLILRDDIILQISSLFVAVIMKESLFFVDKKLLKDLFENLIFDWAVSAIDVYKSYVNT